MDEAHTHETETRVFMERNGKMLLRYAYQLTHDRREAEDLLQDCALAFYQALLKRKGDPIDEPLAYFKRMLLNRYLRLHRTRVADRHRAESFWSLGSHPHDGTDFTKVVADQDDLWRVLKRLPARQRAALVLRYYDDLGYVEVARILSCREATARSLVNRALLTIRSDPNSGSWSTSTEAHHGRP